MRAARVDANQPGIVRALRAVGASVQSLSAVGDGVPDLLVGFRATNYLLEVKDGTKVPSARKLTDDQEKWHAAWRGQKQVVQTVHEALQAIGAIASDATQEARGASINGGSL